MERNKITLMLFSVKQRKIKSELFSYNEPVLTNKVANENGL